MIKSMTGYGKSVSNFMDNKITVEIKTLNSKNLNLYTKIPDNYSDKELLLRNQAIKILEGGKISFTLTVDSVNDKKLQINTEIIDEYYKQISEIAKKYNHDIKNENIFQVILKMPEVLKPKETEENEELWNEIFQTSKNAILETDKYRIEEGKALEEDILEKVNIIYNLIPEVEKYEDERINIIKERLKSKLTEYVNIEEKNDNRFEQEIIYFLDKLDLNEEKSRLRNHCKYFIETVNSKKSNGSKIGFITQEIGREINTMGAKANHAEIQKTVVMMKEELGKIKEQVLNIL